MAVEEPTFKTKVLRGFLWLGTGTFVGQFISWISTIFVIRLLVPEDYGLMAMAGSFIALLTTFGELGLSAALVQAENITEREIRQIYGFVITSSLACWLICHMAAPLVALFYHEPKVILPLRVLNLNFLLMALYLIPQALFLREMNFKTKAKIDIAAQIVSALSTLLLALLGMGVWALILGMIVMNAIKAVSYNNARSAWLKPILSFKGVGKFIRYGLTLTGSRMVYSGYMLSDTIIVGKFLGQYLLGIYAVALNLASIPVEKVLPLINQVTFTAYARIQNDLERVKRNFLMTTRTIAFASFPIFFGMAGVAHEAIPLILGPKWGSIIIPFQLLCIILPLRAINPNLQNTLNALGEARATLVNAVITGFILVVAFLIGVKYGILGVSVAWVIAYPLAFIITTSYSLKILQIPLRNFWVEIKFPFLASFLMVSVIILLKTMMLTLPPRYSLVLLIALGIVCYLGTTFIFKKDEYRELKKLLQR